MKNRLLLLFLSFALPFQLMAVSGAALAAGEEVEGNPALHQYLVKNFELIRSLTESFLAEYQAHGEKSKSEPEYDHITLALLKDFIFDVVSDIDQTTFAADLSTEDRKMQAYCHFLLGVVFDRIKNYYRAHFEYDLAMKLHHFARIETIDLGGEVLHFYMEIQRFNQRRKVSEKMGVIQVRIRNFPSFSPLKSGIVILDKASRLPVDPRIIEVIDERIAMGDTDFETLLPYGTYSIDHKDKDIYIKNFYLIQEMDTVRVILEPNHWFSIKFDPEIPSSDIVLFSEGTRYWNLSYLKFGKYNILLRNDKYFLKNELNEFVLPPSLSARKAIRDEISAYEQHYPEIGQTYVLKLGEKVRFQEMEKEEKEGVFKRIGNVFREIFRSIKGIFTF